MKVEEAANNITSIISCKGGKNMKLTILFKTIGRIYLYLVGAFFILMSIDCFGDTGCVDCNNFWEHLICFGISILPGVVIILINYFLRHKENILGLFLIILSITLFFLLKFYREFDEKILTFIIVVFLPLSIGIFFTTVKRDHK